MLPLCDAVVADVEHAKLGIGCKRVWDARDAVAVQSQLDEAAVGREVRYALSAAVKRGVVSGDATAKARQHRAHLERVMGQGQLLQAGKLGECLIIHVSEAVMGQNDRVERLRREAKDVCVGARAGGRDARHAAAQWHAR